MALSDTSTNADREQQRRRLTDELQDQQPRELVRWLASS